VSFFLIYGVFVARKKKKVVEEKQKKAKKKPRPTTENDILSLGVPNLNTLPTLYEDKPDADEFYPPDPTTQYSEADLDSSVPGSEFWKLLSLSLSRWSTQRLTIEVDGRRNPAFIDARYEVDGSPIGGLAPPTWMDGELFLRTVLADKEIQQLMEQVAATTSTKPKAAIEERLEVLLETKYIEYLKAQFKLVKPLLAKWIMARAIWEKDDTKKKTKKAAK
jgi:hypothetical protein